MSISVMSSFKNFFLRLDLFEFNANTSDEKLDEQQKHFSIIATRLYLLLIFLVLVAVALALWCTPQTVIITIDYPSQQQFATAPADAHCACSHIALTYSDFVTIEPKTFHPICSSDFVSERWITALSVGSNVTYFNLRDFRTSASSQFQALAAFCRLSKQTVQYNIVSFNRNLFISPEVISRTVLTTQVQAVIDDYQSVASNTFQTQLKLILDTTMSNRFVSGLQTNSILKYLVIVNYMNYISLTANTYPIDDRTECNCNRDPDCQASAFIFDVFDPLNQVVFANMTTFQMIIPGMRSGCTPVDAILQSTLTCLYNQTCLDQLISFFPTDETFLAMIDDSHSRFHPNVTVKSMINDLMVDQWMINISFDKYYQTCAPLSCIYTQVTRYHLTFILAKLIGLLSTLTLILKLVISLISKFILKRKNKKNASKIPICVRLAHLKTSLITKLTHLNIFEHYPSNDRQIRYQRYATGFYIICVVISVIILTIYSSWIEVTHHDIVHEPTESDYLRLQKKYSSTLSCPCSSISTPYSSFITVKPDYHQICSSDIVSTAWIAYHTRDLSVQSNFLQPIYTTFAAAKYQLLRTLCQQAQQAIASALHVFLQARFVSSQVLPVEFFETQINASIDEWRLNTVSQYVHIIDLLRETNQGNQLMNGVSNARFVVDSLTLETGISLIGGVDCSCFITKSCFIRVPFYGRTIILNSVPIPYFLEGCSAIEGLLASNFSCLYNRTCMLRIDQGMPNSLGVNFTFSPLDPSRNKPDEPMEALVKRMMVDSWLSNVSFSSYFNSCRPRTCSFDRVGHNDLVLILTTLIGLFGGLSLALKIPIFLILRVIEKLHHGSLHFDRKRFFESIIICNHDYQIIRRVQFIFFVLILSILFVFSAILPQRKTIEVQPISLVMYEGLLRHHGDSLQCSCSQISIPYRSFLTIRPRFHQVCQSDFVDEAWLAYLYNGMNTTITSDPTDFLKSALAQYQMLTSFCRLSNQIVHDTISQLLNSSFIHSHLLSSNSLDETIHITTTSFQASLPNSFRGVLSLIRETTIANKIVTILSTSWKFQTPSTVTYGQTAHTIPVAYENCDCSSSVPCVQMSRGMFAGCYPLENLLYSTFNCLYNQNCVDSANVYRAMNQSQVPSRFNVNTSIEEAVYDLMVEEYIKNIDYGKYYEQCAPSSCMYSYIDKMNVLNGITRLIELYGGLLIICRILAVIIWKIFQQMKTKVNPTNGI